MLVEASKWFLDKLFFTKKIALSQYDAAFNAGIVMGQHLTEGGSQTDDITIRNEYSGIRDHAVELADELGQRADFRKLLLSLIIDTSVGGAALVGLVRMSGY